MDPADNRRRARIDGLEHPVQPHGVLDVLVVGQVDRRALPLDVRAGAEARPLAREHDRSRIPNDYERLAQLGDERGVEGVSTLRARERDAKDDSVTFEAQPAHGAELRVDAC